MRQEFPNALTLSTDGEVYSVAFKRKFRTETAKVESKTQEINASESQSQALSPSMQLDLPKAAEDKSAPNTLRRRKSRKTTTRSKASRRIRGTSTRSIYADERQHG